MMKNAASLCVTIAIFIMYTLLNEYQNILGFILIKCIIYKTVLHTTNDDQCNEEVPFSISLLRYYNHLFYSKADSCFMIMKLNVNETRMLSKEIV